MKVAYIINQYPKVSHSFIRREIHALERLGVTIERIAIRGWDEQSPDAADAKELQQTRYVLKNGAAPLLWAVLTNFLSRPRAFAAAGALAMRMARRSDRAWYFHLIYLAEACLIAKWVARGNIQHLHAHFGTNPTEVAMLAALLAQRTYSFTAHGSVETDHPQFIGLPEKIRRAAFVVAVSSYGRAQLCRWVEPRHWDKIHVVHCGLEKSFHENVVRDVNTSTRLVCVGRLCPEKGQLLLLDALRRVLDMGLSCELVLAGDGELRADVEKRIQELKLHESVRITGWIDGEQVRQEILSARAMVLPSFAEGLPVVIMEALALGRPVVSTYVAGIPELVTHGECGWLVPASDAGSLAEAICECLNAAPVLLDNMGKVGQRRVRTAHDVDTEADKLKALMISAIGCTDTRAALVWSSAPKRINS